MTRFWSKLLLTREDERGQATVEYFLVILAATALAIIALKWLQSGSGGGLLGDLFGKVISWVVGKF
jgi:Flp pilus assembly pilin Flp